MTRESALPFCFAKIYAESFRDRPHLETIVREAEDIVSHALQGRPDGR